MLNDFGKRELVYIVRVDDVSPIEGKDRVVCARVGGWTCMVPKGAFQIGDLGVYHEIDSKCPAKEPYLFLEKRKYHIKTQKFGTFYSQGLLMPAADFGWTYDKELDKIIVEDGEALGERTFLTERLGVTHYAPDDAQKSINKNNRYKKMASRHPKLFKNPVIKWIYKTSLGKKFLFLFLGKKKDKIRTHFPNHFPYIHKTDQERCENMTWVLQDKSPFIVTQKCDGSSGTFILEKERKLFKTVYEFYVCSRNVRQLDENQQSYYEENHYWEVAKKYDIKNKLLDYLQKHPELEYVCWQGEVCAPPIQKNPHKLKETHLFLFHMIDSEKGMYNILEAAKIWEEYDMEYVPIVDTNYILPDDFEEFKQTADGYYDSSCCEGQEGCPREGFVYYKASDPNFSFKNVSRSYLAKH